MASDAFDFYALICRKLHEISRRQAGFSKSFRRKKRGKNAKKMKKSCEKFGELKKVPIFAPAEREKHSSAKQFFRKKTNQKIEIIWRFGKHCISLQPRTIREFYGKFESRGIGNGFKRRNKFFEVIKQLKFIPSKFVKTKM